MDEDIVIGGVVPRGKPKRRNVAVDGATHEAILEYAKRRGGLRVQAATEELIHLALRVARVPVVGIVADSTTEASKEV